MRTIRLFFALLIFVALSQVAFSQQHEQLTLQEFNPLNYNPAYAGSQNAISVVGIGRFQWTGMEGSPNTQWLSINSPVMGQSFGAGFHLVNDKIGVRNHTSAFIDLSTSIRLNSRGDRLAFGLSGGLDMTSVEFTKLSVHDKGDVYNTQFSDTKFNMGAGIFYYSDKSYLGFSVPRVLRADGKGVNNNYAQFIERHFFLSAGHVFMLNSMLKFKPSVILKYAPYSPMAIDLSGSLILYDFLQLGATYRVTEALGAHVVFTVKEICQIGYGYEYPLAKFSRFQSGTHEILLKFDITMKKLGYYSPRYF